MLLLVAAQAQTWNHVNSRKSKIAREKTRSGPSSDDLLSYLLYPDVFTKYDKFRQTIPTSAFCPRPRFSIGLNPAKKSPSKSIREVPHHQMSYHQRAASRRTRTLFLKLNGQPREVNVRDRALRVVERAHPKADPADPGRLRFPLPRQSAASPCRPIT